MFSYFAYGANLDRAAMAIRCPGSVLVGAAHLERHRFFIMDSGFASVRPDPAATVFGLLWLLEPTDLALLDRFEDVDAGLYERTTSTVIGPLGPTDAMIYRGCNLNPGRPQPGYLEAVLAAAETCGLPEPYRRDLSRWLSDGRTGDAGIN